MSMQSLSFAAQITDLPGHSHSEFLKALTWDRSADQALRVAADQGNVAAFCKAWQASHRPTDASSKAGASSSFRTLWSQQAFPEESGLGRVILQATGTPIKKPSASRRPVNKPAIKWSQRIQQIVTELTTAVSSAEFRPFALLASLELLDQSGYRLPAEQFFALWRQTLSELLMWPTAMTGDPTVPADVLTVEHGEIPFVGGIVFCEIASAANLVKAGRKFLMKELIDKTDTDGTPHADIVPRLSLWLAPLVRATMASDQHQENLWSDDQRQLLSNVVDRAILLCRPNGRAALGNGLQLDPLPMLTAAADLFGLQMVESTGTYLQALQRAVAGKPPRRSRSEIATMPSNQSDWARFALLRSNWDVDADSVAIMHHQPLPQIDVTALGRPLIHGDWNLKLTIGDALIELAEEWSCVCWQSDPDADYIELQMAGPGKLRLERLVMLSRKEHFLMVADSVSGVPLIPSSQRARGTTGRQRIEYESRLHLCEGMAGSCEGTTREGRISGQRLKARVFPLGIPQDRVNSTPHELSMIGDEIVLKHVAEGEGLFAPLVFSWHPGRSRVDASWRTLTVTENGQVVGPDVAVGYRLKLGDYQLMISRSLKKTGYSRACLGHHTFNETMIGSFDSNGDIEPILMVE